MISMQADSTLMNSDASMCLVIRHASRALQVIWTYSTQSRT